MAAQSLLPSHSNSVEWRSMKQLIANVIIAAAAAATTTACFTSRPPRS